MTQPYKNGQDWKPITYVSVNNYYLGWKTML
jgi:hypothetical protein